MRNRLCTRRELLKVLLAAQSAAMFPGMGSPSIAIASPSPEIRVAGDVGLVDRTAEQPHRIATNIKVVGVGGAGANVVELMIRNGFPGAEFISVDTDIHSLYQSSTGTKIHLGRSGGGTWRQSEIWRDLATEARGRIASALKGAEVAFIVAGLGGRTGTGAALIVAEVARELGILTIATVFLPFGFESQRMPVAIAGANELSRMTDALILVPIESMMEAVAAETPFGEFLDLCSRQVEYAINGILNNIFLNGVVKLDLDDLRLVMTGAGICATGSAAARGDDRALIATMSAMYSPTMQVLHPSRRRFIVFNVVAGHELKHREINMVFRTLRSNFSGEAMILGGAVFDDGMEDRLRVTLVAGGMKSWPPI